MQQAKTAPDIDKICCQWAGRLLRLGIGCGGRIGNGEACFASGVRGPEENMSRKSKILALSILILAFAASALAQETISPYAASRFIGQQKTVCGMVASAKYAARSKGRPTFLNLDKPYPNQVFTVLI
jgi:preprotein translocase subunit SecG